MHTKYQPHNGNINSYPLFHKDAVSLGESEMLIYYSNQNKLS